MSLDLRSLIDLPMVLQRFEKMASVRLSARIHEAIRARPAVDVELTRFDVEKLSSRYNRTSSFFPLFANPLQLHLLSHYCSTASTLIPVRSVTHMGIIGFSEAAAIILSVQRSIYSEAGRIVGLLKQAIEQVPRLFVSPLFYRAANPLPAVLFFLFFPCRSSRRSSTAP